MPPSRIPPGKPVLSGVSGFPHEGGGTPESRSAHERQGARVQTGPSAKRIVLALLGASPFAVAATKGAATGTGASTLPMPAPAERDDPSCIVRPQLFPDPLAVDALENQVDIHSDIHSPGRIDEAWLQSSVCGKAEPESAQALDTCPQRLLEFGGAAPAAGTAVPLSTPVSQRAATVARPMSMLLAGAGMVAAGGAVGAALAHRRLARPLKGPHPVARQMLGRQPTGWDQLAADMSQRVADRISRGSWPPADAVKQRIDQLFGWSARVQSVMSAIGLGLLALPHATGLLKDLPDLQRMEMEGQYQTAGRLYQHAGLFIYVVLGLLDGSAKAMMLGQRAAARRRPLHAALEVDKTPHAEDLAGLLEAVLEGLDRESIEAVQAQLHEHFPWLAAVRKDGFSQMVETVFVMFKMEPLNRLMELSSEMDTEARDSMDHAQIRACAIHLLQHLKTSGAINDLQARVAMEHVKNQSESKHPFPSMTDSPAGRFWFKNLSNFRPVSQDHLRAYEAVESTLQYKLDMPFATYSTQLGEGMDALLAVHAGGEPSAAEHSPVTAVLLGTQDRRADAKTWRKLMRIDNHDGAKNLSAVLQGMIDLVPQEQQDAYRERLRNSVLAKSQLWQLLGGPDAGSAVVAACLIAEDSACKEVVPELPQAISFPASAEDIRDGALAVLKTARDQKAFIPVVFEAFTARASALPGAAEAIGFTGPHRTLFAQIQRVFGEATSVCDPRELLWAVAALEAEGVPRHSVWRQTLGPAFQALYRNRMAVKSLEKDDAGRAALAELERFVDDVPQERRADAQDYLKRAKAAELAPLFRDLSFGSLADALEAACRLAADPNLERLLLGIELPAPGRDADQLDYAVGPDAGQLDLGEQAVTAIRMLRFIPGLNSEKINDIALAVLKRPADSADLIQALSLAGEARMTAQEALPNVEFPDVQSHATSARRWLGLLEQRFGSQVGEPNAYAVALLVRAMNTVGIDPGLHLEALKARAKKQADEDKKDLLKSTSSGAPPAVSP